jgi:glycosyltransferase involved in cell wall biosynthesis
MDLMSIQDNVFRKPRPLRVLTVGTIGLRKGSHYVLQAAKETKGKVELRMVGSIDVGPEVIRQLQQCVSVLGPIPRTEMLMQYHWADVFLLPSLCEGSATASYEALAYGLPIITTPNAGSVVRDGVDGFIVPVGDPEAIVQRLDMLASQPMLRLQMSSNARGRAKEFTLATYSSRLMQALSNGVGHV